MSIFDVVAFDWSVDSDLEAAGIFASGYRARYSQPLASNQQWDNGIFGGINGYRGESNPDIVRIRGEFEGMADIVIVGIVDRNGISFQNSVIGDLVGRDLLALMLDKYPTPSTFVLGSDVITAIVSLAAMAGLSVVYDAPSYILGRDVAITADRTIAEWIEDFLAPLRWADRHRVDTWIESNTLYVADRMEFARGSVSLPYDRVILERMEETALPIVDGVYVEGASYDALEPLSGEITSNTEEDVQTTISGNTTTVITTRTTEWLDALGRLFRRDRSINTETFVDFILKLVVFEQYYMFASFFYGESYPVPIHGKRAGEIETGTKTRLDG